MRALAVALIALGVPGLAACGSSGGAPSPTIKPGLDACVVGTWKSTGAHGTVTSSDGTLHIPLSGGAGQLTVIRRDGTATITYDGAQPLRGVGTDGSTYMVSASGQIAGTVRTGGGQVTLDVANPDNATQTISKDGAVLQTTHAPPELVSPYTCTAHTAFDVTTNGITVTMVPVAT
ncbi:MAG TPA: hypothetical protein VF155_10745 [Candidatus Dormibacteraeota bacterium]